LQPAAPSPIVWDEQGTPRSTLFDDVYRSRGFHGMDRGLLQARHVFLQGCGLWSPSGEPTAWQTQDKWHVLETGFGLGLNFLATWLAWQQDPQRPQRLFFSSIEAWPVSAVDIERSAQAWPELQPLATEFTQAWRGLMPGLHRLVFEGGRVQLTLCIGPVDKMLREIDVTADSIYLDGFSPDVNPQMWDLHTLKAVARLCRPGARVASWCVKRSVREDLAQCGFAVERADGLPPKSHRLQAVFAPHWTPRTQLRQPTHQPPHDRDALVLGAGLSGSAVACSLARRGWRVQVLDAGQGVGAGASGLPAGLTVPHVSPDDSLLSRITRAGVRATVQRCAQLLQSGKDWQLSGVLEHRVEGKRALPEGNAWPPTAHEWSTPGTPKHNRAVGLSEQAQTLWHRMAAWLQPRRLVQAQLATPGVQVRWQARVAQLRHLGEQWQALDAQGTLLGQAPVLVVAGGYDTLELLKPFTQAIAFNPLRGQISMGRLDTLPEGLRAKLPPVPVNGHGSFITGVPLPAEFGGHAGWYLGSTFERACTEPVLRSEDHAANHQRLATLLPDLSEPMRPGFAPGHVLGWAGLRCTLPDRVPSVGAVDHEKYPGLMVCAGMGARGISLSVLCGELIAAELEGEPLPLEPALAQRLKAERFNTMNSKKAKATPAASAAQSAHSP
jgi:tRNA 5-methylaminomethyl-2-thiouridine biosynthesis bifunctional protein